MKGSSYSKKIQYVLCFFLLIIINSCSMNEQNNLNEQIDLKQLCERSDTKTDKCAFRHNYVEAYEIFFNPLRDKAAKIFEIGVLHGNSLRLWKYYFTNAQIYGIDIEDTSKHETNRIKTFIADQSNRDQLAKVMQETGGNFDIIIDDGGHSMKLQQTSFGYLFPHLKSKGLYIIEDIHTSFPNLYPNYGVEKDEQNSTFNMIINHIKTYRFKSKYLTESEMEYLNNNVEYCLYFYRTNKFHSDFFLCKKK